MRTTLPICLLFLILVILPGVLYGYRFYAISVGVVSGPEDDSRQNSRKFWTFNGNTNVILEPVVEDIRWWGSIQLTRAVCSLLKTGIHAFVASPPPRLYPLMKSYATRFHLPLISASAPIDQLKDDVALLPNTVAAVADLIVRKYQWPSFAYIYDSDAGPALLEKIMEATDHKIHVDAFWRVSSGEETRRYLRLLNAGEASSKRILLATTEQLLDEIIAIPATESYHFILANPASTIKENVGEGPQGSYLVTKLSAIVRQDNAVYRELENRWHTILHHLRRSSRDKTIPNSALVTRDIISIVEQGFLRLLEESSTFNLTSRGLNCLEDKPMTSIQYLNAVRMHMKKVVFERGMTGRIQFTANGERTGYTFDIAEVTPSGTKKIGTWSTKSRLVTGEDTTTETQLDDPSKEKLVDKPMTKKIIVTSILGDTLLRLNQEDNDTKNEQFEGFAKDLIAILSSSLGWNYELHLAKDGQVGEKQNDGRWTGMIGEVIRQEADIAIGPIEITSDRSEDVDFSKPILNVGLNILVKRPNYADRSFVGIEPTGFLQVWTYKIWLLLLLAYAAVGCATYAVSHFTGEPDRIRSLDTKLSDRLSPCSSFWFVLGSLTFRGTGIYPRSVTHRLLSLVWWAFSLMVFIYYVSSVTSLFIKDRMKSDTTVYPMKSNEFLQNFVDKGYPKVKILKKETYFKSAEIGLHKEYGKIIANDNSLLVNNLEEGVEKVRSSDGSIALIVDSTSGHYFSRREPCDTMVTSGYLIHRPYAIVFSKGSRLRESVDHIILQLMASGEMRRLYEKWWYHNSSCVDPYFNVLPSLYSSSLTLDEVSGVFYFLIGSMFLAAIAAVAEYFLRSKRVSVDN